MPKDPNWKPITYRTPEQKERDKRLALKKKARETGAWEEGKPFKMEYLKEVGATSEDIKRWLEPSKTPTIKYPGEPVSEKGRLWFEQQTKKYGTTPTPSQIQSYEAQFAPGVGFPEGSAMWNLGFRTQAEYTEAQRYGFKYGPHPGSAVPRGSLVITTPSGEPYARFYGSKPPPWVETAMKEGRYAESPYGAPTTGIYGMTQQYPGIKDYEKYYYPETSFEEFAGGKQPEWEGKWNEWWGMLPPEGRIDEATLQNRLNTMRMVLEGEVEGGTLSEGEARLMAASALEQARWILEMPLAAETAPSFEPYRAGWRESAPTKYMPKINPETYRGEWEAMGAKEGVPLAAGALEGRRAGGGRGAETAEARGRNPQEIYYAMLPEFPSPAMKEYYYQSYAPVYREFLNTLGMEEVTNEEFLERWKIFLTRYAWENKYMARPPRMRGEYSSLHAPPTRHLTY